jgi:hypothetical protein
MAQVRPLVVRPFHERFSQVDTVDKPALSAIIGAPSFSLRNR